MIDMNEKEMIEHIIEKVSEKSLYAHNERLKNGYLITTDGYLVGDGIQLPVTYDNLEIKPNGDVEVFSDEIEVVFASLFVAK